MEKFNNLNNPLESSEERVNTESIYSFPEIMEPLKIGMESLVLELKDMIDHGEYNTLISDEAAARLPTLILREVIKNKAPNGKDLNTYFLALGEGMHPDIDPISIEDRDESERKFLLDNPQKFILRNKDSLKKALIVTEHIHTGNTIVQIMREFDEVGYTNYDIATISQYHDYFKNWVENDGHKFFTGKGIDITKTNSKGIGYKRLSGVRKEEDGASYYQDEKFRRAIFGAHPVRRFSPGSSNYDKEEQDNVNKARKDIKIIAQEIINKVWQPNVDVAK